MSSSLSKPLNNPCAYYVEVAEFLLEQPLLAWLTEVVTSLRAVQTVLVLDHELLRLPVETHLCHMRILLEQVGLSPGIGRVNPELIGLRVESAHQQELMGVVREVKALVQVVRVRLLVPVDETLEQTFLFDLTSHSKHGL